MLYTVVMDQSTNRGTSTTAFQSPVRTAFGYQPAGGLLSDPPSPSDPTTPFDQSLPSNPSTSPVPPASVTPETGEGVAQPSAQQQPAAQTADAAQSPAAAQPEDQAAPPEYANEYDEFLLYEWKAPSRTYKKRKRQYFMTVITIGILLSLILFFAGQILPIAVVFAVVFLAYVMAVVPPHDITFTLTSYGVRIEEELYFWEELGRFWFTDIHGQRVAHVELSRFPFKLSMVLGEEGDEKEITEIMSVVLFHERPKPTLYEQIAEWLQKKFPLDLDS